MKKITEIKDTYKKRGSRREPNQPTKTRKKIKTKEQETKVHRDKKERKCPEAVKRTFKKSQETKE